MKRFDDLTPKKTPQQIILAILSGIVIVGVMFFIFWLFENWLEAVLHSMPK